MSKQYRKQTLGMAGEYFVTAELNRRGISSSMTYGNAKKADVVAFSSEKKSCEVIEVKTTDKTKWIIGNGVPEPSDDLWVLVLLQREESARYFILTATDLYNLLHPLDVEYRERYFKKHGKEFDGKGVVSLTQSQALAFESKWTTITDRF